MQEDRLSTFCEEQFETKYQKIILAALSEHYPVSKPYAYILGGQPKGIISAILEGGE